MIDIKLVAQTYIDAGWQIVPLVKGEKRASGSWQKRTYKASDFKDDDGIAGKCGEPSGWRTDVDCDAVECVEAAKVLLPDTGLVHGRPGKPDSHYWFVVEGAKTTQFTDVKDNGGKTSMLVEIRSTGGYTCLPPSTHPSGDVLAWAIERDPMQLQLDALHAAVCDVAICGLVARHYPGHGARHFFTGHLAGFLLQAGLDSNRVLRLIKVIATIAQDGDFGDRVAFAQTTVGKHAAGEKITGGPKLAECIGDDVVAKLRLWLKVRDENAIILNPNDPMPSARVFVEREHTVEDVIALRHQAGVFYRYEGAYREVEDAKVRAELYRFLEDAKRWTKDDVVPFQPTKSKLENVLDALRGLTNLPAAMAAPCWLDQRSDVDPMSLLPCHNGLLHLPTRDLFRLTPTFFTLNGLDFDFDASAPAPNEWLAFLRSIWPDDQEAIDTLQEMFGYVLTVDTSFQKIFLVVGPKRSGKGTIARILRLLIGSRNVCNPTLASFGRDFGKQVLVGKTLAIVSDARLSGKTDAASVAEALLSISGEDSQTVARKFLPDWNGQLLVRFLLLTNELPRIGDMSGALASRFVVLHMTKSFYGEEDLGLYPRLKTEIPGILNWALAGRDRLYARGYFRQPASAEAVAQQLDDLGSPIKVFIRECCDIMPGAEIKKKDVFSAWQRWCVPNNVANVGTTQTFGRDLRAALPGITDGQRRPERDWYWRGLRLKNENDGPLPF